MKNTNLLLLALMLIFNMTISQAAEPAITPVGEWLFDDAADLTKSSCGQALILTGSHTAIAGPDANNGAVRIGVGSYYTATAGITPNGKYVNTYSLLFDFRVKDIVVYRALVQSDNSDDADLFIRSGNGTFGTRSTRYSTKAVVANTWNRLIVVVNNGTEYSLYLNGEKILIGDVQAIDSRFALRPTFGLFQDDDGDDGEIDVARVSLYNKALSAEEVLAFGGFKPETPKKAFLTKPYLQNATTNGMTIMWESDSNIAGTVNYGLSSGSYSNSVSSIVTTTNANTYIHKARITSLAEHTKYYYQVVAATDLISDQKSFITATSDVNTSFRVGIWGDSHHPDPFSKMASYMIDNLNPDFAFATGDVCTNNGGDRTDLVKVFIPKVLEVISSKVPFYVSLGNHDVGAPWGGNLIRQYLDQPSANNSDPSNFNGSFTYTFANSIFISIDWNRTNTELLPGAWLENTLKSSASAQSKFRFIFIHNAPFYERWQAAENSIIKTNLPVLCEKYGVTAVFSGHMHGYERGYLNGVQYITQGGGSYMDTGEAVGPIIYPHIVVGTSKAGNPPNFNNGMTNHILTLDVTTDKATVKLHYFDGSGNYLGVIESVDMWAQTPTKNIKIISDTDFSISPNPAKGYLDISAPNNVDFSIYNLGGQLILSKKSIQKKSKVDISTLEKGAYLIKLGGNSSEYSKVIFVN